MAMTALISNSTTRAADEFAKRLEEQRRQRRDRMRRVSSEVGHLMDESLPMYRYYSFFDDMRSDSLSETPSSAGSSGEAEWERRRSREWERNVEDAVKRATWEGEEWGRKMASVERDILNRLGQSMEDRETRRVIHLPGSAPYRYGKSRASSGATETETSSYTSSSSSGVESMGGNPVVPPPTVVSPPSYDQVLSAKHTWRGHGRSASSDDLLEGMRNGLWKTDSHKPRKEERVSSVAMPDILHSTSNPNPGQMSRALKQDYYPVRLSHSQLGRVGDSGGKLKEKLQDKKHENGTTDKFVSDPLLRMKSKTVNDLCSKYETLIQDRMFQRGSEGRRKRIKMRGFARLWSSPCPLSLFRPDEEEDESDDEGGYEIGKGARPSSGYMSPLHVDTARPAPVVKEQVVEEVLSARRVAPSSTGDALPSQRRAGGDDGRSTTNYMGPFPTERVIDDHLRSFLQPPVPLYTGPGMSTMVSPRHMSPGGSSSISRISSRGILSPGSTSRTSEPSTLEDSGFGGSFRLNGSMSPFSSPKSKHVHFNESMTATNQFVNSY